MRVKKDDKLLRCLGSSFLAIISHFQSSGAVTTGILLQTFGEKSKRLTYFFIGEKNAFLLFLLQHFK
jgi:hypothetical protein